MQLAIILILGCCDKNATAQFYAKTYPQHKHIHKNALSTKTDLDMILKKWR